jgi:hypothetical protein
MPQDFLIGKQSFLKVDSTRNYVQENKVKLSVDTEILKNRAYNRFDVSKDPLSAFIANTAVSTFNQSIDTPIPIIYSSMSLYLDASNKSSYPGSGTTWYDLSVYGNNFTLNADTTYSSNFLEIKSNSSTNKGAVCVNTTCGNFGSGSFTFEYIASYTGSGVGGIECIILKRGSPYSIGYQYNPGFVVRQGANGWFVQDDNPTNTISNNMNNVVGEINAQSKIPATSSLVHMAFVIEHNGTSVTGSRYKNGVFQSLDKKEFIGNNEVNNNSAMQIGYFTTGSVAVVRTYSRALSSDEVLQNFNATKTKYGL